MVTLPRERANWQLSLYAVYLAAGNNLLCKSLKSGTIATYLLNVASLAVAAHPKGRDPRKIHDTDTSFAPCIARVLKEIKRWEQMPNRQEPFTPKMQRYLFNKVAAARASPSLLVDHLEEALSDWFDLGGCYAGFRLSEWAQPSSSSLASPAIKFGAQLPTAFLADDFRFELNSGRRISAFSALSLELRSIRAVLITWRTQKNGQNGEVKSFIRNDISSTSCPVASALRIVRRFVSLVGLSTTVPLAVFFNVSSGRPALINSPMIDAVMQSVARDTYDISNPLDLRRWTSHSLRIGAAVVLHSHGFSDSQIKFTLRWRSNAFMDYLRNSDIVALKQNTAVSMAADGILPNI